MKKMINRSLIEGILVEKTLRAGVTKKGIDYVAGKLQIDTGNGNVVTVDVFEQEKTSKGDQNKKYQTLLKLYEDGNTVMDGSENPTKLKVSSALELNDWTNTEGQLVSSLINSGGYVNIVNQVDPKSEFEVDIVIKNVQPEILREEETGRCVVNGLIFNYRGHALAVRFVVENKEGVRFFSDMEPGTFTKVWGTQVSRAIVNEKIESSAFGGDRVVKSTYNRKEFLITGANSLPYEEEDLSQEELTSAIQARNLVLAEKEASSKDAAKTSSITKPSATTSAPKKATFNF